MSGPLPFPAAEFLADPAVRLAISRKDYEVVVALLLMACAGWQANHDRGSFPDDPERVAAIVGLPAEVLPRAIEFWVAEGWIKREDGTLYIPFVTKNVAEQEASEAAISAQRQGAALARWRPGSNKVLFASDSDTDRNATVEEDGWPKDYTRWGCDVWNKKCGKGAAAGGEVAGQFRALRKAGAEWPEVQESWTRYVAFTEPRFLSPGAWRKRWQTWLSDSPDHDQQALDVASSLDKQIRRGDFESVGAVLKKGGIR